MDYKKLAQSHLETALSKGIIELENGEIKELKTSEILAVAKFVFKEGWISDEEVVNSQSKNFPSEMFTLISQVPLEEEIAYTDARNEARAVYNLVPLLDKEADIDEEDNA